MKNKLFFTVLIFIIIILLGLNIYQLVNYNNKELIAIDRIEVFDEILNEDSGEYIYIDLRDKEDYIKGHIKSFLNFPYNDENRGLINFLSTLDKNRKVLLICYGGNRSARVFSQLVRNDFKYITDFTLGYNKYKEEKGALLNEATGDCGCPE